MNLRSWLNNQRRNDNSLSFEGGDRAPLPEDGDECVLIDAARQGNREAFDLLVRTQLPTLHRFLAGRIGRRDAVEDIVQETLLGAWTALPGFEPRVRFRTWLLRIAANKTADYLRLAVRRDRYEESLEGKVNVTASEDLEADAERRGMVRQALSHLSGPQREVIEMYYYAELTLAEISQLTGRNVNTVKYQFYAAHTAAAAALREDSDDFSTNFGASRRAAGHGPSVSHERLLGPSVTCMVSPKTIRKAGQ
ncbi:MAG: RNA polymerase sigma factor [Armatimonadota bacterium]